MSGCPIPLLTAKPARWLLFTAHAPTPHVFRLPALGLFKPVITHTAQLYGFPREKTSSKKKFLEGESAQHSLFLPPQKELLKHAQLNPGNTPSWLLNPSQTSLSSILPSLPGVLRCSTNRPLSPVASLSFTISPYPTKQNARSRHVPPD